VEQPGQKIEEDQMKDMIKIIGLPMDLGQANRGVDMGPSAIRYADLSVHVMGLGFRIEDAGNIQVSVRNALQEKNLQPEIRRACEMVYNSGKEAIDNGYLPLFLGGDHSISIGTIGGITHKSPSGVIWIDAHGDFNIPETSQTGCVHGMPLAVLTGRGPSELVNIGRPGAKLVPENVLLIGVRDLDAKERILLKECGIKTFTMRDIDEHGIRTIAHKALDHLSHLSRIHVSLDMDALDPREAPGVGTPVPGGLTYREAHLLMEIIADSKRLASMDIVEINPILDKYNQTAKIAVELAVSLFGKSIM